MNGDWDGDRHWLSQALSLRLLVAGVRLAGNSLGYHLRPGHGALVLEAGQFCREHGGLLHHLPHSLRLDWDLLLADVRL